MIRVKKTSLRIESIVQLIDHNQYVYDIGCDHGLIGLLALKEKSPKKVYFVDESKTVIENLKKKFTTLNLELKNSEILHKRAEDLIIPESKSTFIIAGVGYKTIERILKLYFAKGILNKKKFILCSNSQLDKVLDLVHELNMRCISKTIISEDGQRYEILKTE